MPNLRELLAQRDSLEQQIAQARQHEIEAAIANIRHLIAEFDLSQADIFGATKGVKRAKKQGALVAPKYRDPASGKTWSGRGRTPQWLAGKDKEQFAIK